MYWAGVGGGEIEARAGEARVEILRFLEIFDGRVKASGLISFDALIEFVAGFELVAAAENDERNDHYSERNRNSGLRCIPTLLRAELNQKSSAQKDSKSFAIR